MGRPAGKRVVPTKTRKEKGVALMNVERVNITPQLATRYLKRNLNNRNLREADVDRYARDMTAGRWQETGDTIKISPTGTLLDGQHRLEAIIRASLTVPMLVVSGIPQVAKTSIDTGITRNAQDIARWAGVKHADVVPTAIRALGIANGNEMKLSAGEIIDIYSATPQIAISVARYTFLKNEQSCPFSAGTAAGYHAHFATEDQVLADEYMDGVVTGEKLRKGDPAYAVRSRFLEMRARGGRLSRTNLRKGLLRGWEAIKAGETISRLYIVERGKGVNKKG